MHSTRHSKPRLAALLLLLASSCGGDDRRLDATGVDSVGDTPNVADNLVFNEVSLVSGDYVELINIGTAPIDIGGYRLVDQVDSMPRPDQAVVFDVGEVLAAGEILLIQAGLAGDARPGEQSACGPGVPPGCYFAAWALSNVTGDTLYLIAPDGEGVLEFEYMAGTVTEGAWGRLPDGTGAFANTAYTPGQANSPYVAP